MAHELHVVRLIGAVADLTALLKKETIYVDNVPVRVCLGNSLGPRSEEYAEHFLE